MIKLKFQDIKYSHIVTLLAMFFIGYLSLDRSLWIDEAMILVNISEVDFYDMFKPLPYYTQASPLIPLFFQKLIYNLSDGDFYILRLCSYVFSFCLVIVFLSNISKEKGLDWRIWLATLTLATYTFLYYSTEIKHYIFEFSSSLLLILALIHYLKNEYNKAFLFSVVAIFLGFSNIIPLGIILTFIFSIKIINKEKMHMYLRYFIISIGIVLAQYLYMKYLVSYQISGHDVYISKGVVNDTRSLISSVVAAHGVPLILLTAISLLYGLSNLKKSVFFRNFSFLYLAIATSVFILKITSLYPVVSGRHVFWLVPFSITLSSLFIQTVINKGRYTKKILILLTALIFIIQSIKFIDNNEHTDNKALISKINELCLLDSVNLIATEWSDRVIHAYKNDLDGSCMISSNKTVKFTSYEDLFLEKLKLYKSGEKNYLIISHIDIYEEYDHPQGYYKYKEYLIERNLHYKIIFYAKNVAILYIYE
jgi:hypothetical protein